MPSPTYAWAVLTPPSVGNGTFAAPSSQSTGFTGSQRGAVTVQVTVQEGTCSCKATAPVQVIEINDLTDSVPEDYYTEIATTGSYTVPYSDSYGTLLAVLISPTLDPSNPYQWHSDFDGQVVHTTGDVTITMNRPGPYLIQAVRTEGSETFELLYQAAPSSEGASKTGKTARIAAPSADLICISSSAADNGFLKNARAAIPAGVAIGSVNDVITAINNAYKANGNVPITLAVIDHGRSGWQSMGDGDVTVVGGYIGYQDAPSANDLKNFMAACNTAVVSCTFYGCHVADLPDGPAFLQQLATGGAMDITAYTGSVYCSSAGKWSASNNGTSVTKTP